MAREFQTSYYFFASNKEGFIEIATYDWHVKNVYKVETKNGEPLIKVFFMNFETRQIYFEGRKNVTPADKLWLREDLTKPRQNLAYHTRIMVGKGNILKTWTSLGIVLAMKVGHDKPVRINTLEDILN